MQVWLISKDVYCRFFASLIQRGARLLGKGSRPGGSLTLVPILPGMPATGEPGAKPAQVAAYQHLSPQQKERLLAALERTSQQAAAGPAPEGCVSTEVSNILLFSVTPRSSSAKLGAGCRAEVWCCTRAWTGHCVLHEPRCKASANLAAFTSRTCRLPGNHNRTGSWLSVVSRKA